VTCSGAASKKRVERKIQRKRTTLTKPTPASREQVLRLEAHDRDAMAELEHSKLLEKDQIFDEACSPITFLLGFCSRHLVRAAVNKARYTSFEVEAGEAATTRDQAGKAHFAKILAACLHSKQPRKCKS
jgi:hypothetical protein